MLEQVQVKKNIGTKSASAKSVSTKTTIPDIPGLTFRRFQGKSDYPAMLAVINGCKEADQDDYTRTLEGLTRDYSNLVNCDPYRDMVLVEMSGDLIGYGRVFWYDLDEGIRIYGHFANLLPAWRDRGIRKAMLKHNERRAREMVVENPCDIPVQFEAWASEAEENWRALLLNAGYEAIRYGYQMVRPDLENIPDLPLPEGLKMRTISQDKCWQVWRAAQEAFRDHWGYSEDEWNDIHFETWMKDPTFTPNLWQVAWEGDEVAGMVLNFINKAENEEYQRKRGYTETICVRRPWRRRGLARALIARSLEVLKKQDMTEAALGVDAQNPNGALQLYKSMGFCITKTYITYRKPME